MYCPFCTYGRTTVVDSVWDDTHQTIRRERLCLHCKYQWVTLEIDHDQVEFLTSIASHNKYRFLTKPDIGQLTEEKDPNPPIDN